LFAQAKKSKKKGKKNKENIVKGEIVHPEISSHKKPQQMQPEYYCVSCIVTAQRAQSMFAG